MRIQSSVNNDTFTEQSDVAAVGADGQAATSTMGLTAQGLTAKQEQQIVQIIVELCGEPEIAQQPDIDLFQAGLLDSMAAIEMLVAFEELFGIEIGPTAIERDDLRSVNLIIERMRVFLQAS